MQMNYKTPSFEKSFANHPKAIYWSKINTINPIDIYQGSVIKVWFDCDNCKHNFQKSLYDVKRGGWCPYCSGDICRKLCDNNNCEYCFNKSFISIYNSKYIVDKLINPRYIIKNNREKYDFKCNKCNHTFKATPKSVTEGYWCPYCYHSLCDNNSCNYCFIHSFASNQKSKYWSSKNLINPRQLRHCSKVKIIFNCDICNNEFKSELNSITKGHWCPICRYKTEKKLLKWLNDNYNDIYYQPKYEWCKSKKCSKLLSFDFEYNNIIIELDGEQHFRQIGNWKSPEENLERDIFKMKCALENKKHIIRINQITVFKDINNWDIRLKDTINILLMQKEYQVKYIDIDSSYFDLTKH